MKNIVYRELLDLLMCSDQEPCDLSHLRLFADEEARRRGYAHWIAAYHEMPRTADEEKGVRSPIPGVPAETAVISSQCRRNHGDVGAIDIALARVKRALIEAMKSWPLAKDATFFVVGLVDRTGRRSLHP